MNIKTKVFFDLIFSHTRDPKRVKRFIKIDKRLTMSEKQILNGFLLMRDNKNAEALELAEDISSQADDFVECLRFFLLAATLNNLGHYEKALVYFQKSRNKLVCGALPNLEYVLLNNISNVYLNLHKTVKAQEVLEEMQALKGISDENQNRLDLQCLYVACVNEDRKMADKYFHRLKQIEDKFECQAQVILQETYCYYGVVFCEHKLSYQALKVLSGLKKYFQTQHYNYYKLLLEHLTEDAPIYIVEGEFKTHPLRLWELKLIRALEISDRSMAESAWNFLMHQNPYAFQPHFVYQGPKSLFSLCFSKNVANIQKNQLDYVREKNVSMLDAMANILKEKKELTRDELFFYLYGREPESKDEIHRLAKYVSKLKTTKGISVSLKKGVYKIAA